MLFLNRIFSVLTLVILAGCGAGNDMRPDASAEVISSASYRHDGPAALTLYTMVIPPFLRGPGRRIYAAIASFWAGVIPPLPMLGRSLL